MRKIFFILAFICIACDSENANDCFQTTGKIIEKQVTVPIFTRILVNENVEMILSQAEEQKVVVQSGENLMNDIKVIVKDGQLILSDENSCNYFRDYGVTKIFVTSPNITEIRSATQFDVSSEGILNFQSLTLLSEDYLTDYQNIGDFRLNLHTESLKLIFNNLSNAYISGDTVELNVNFASGNSRFEGKDLVTQHVIINHRGTNDMHLNPQQSLTGKILSTGNVIAYTRPTIVEVEAPYKGQLIFK